uniref:Uncharacterized protein n=1 Tax=viral metagenome TaxID=1070528 RepID=A0A6C0EXZ3_9ZZZZ
MDSSGSGSPKNNSTNTNSTNTSIVDDVLIYETGPGFINDVSENEVIFVTPEPNLHIPQIYEDLSINVIVVDDENESILSQIRVCASQIKCENFHGKGSIEDYNELFTAASQIANDTKNIELDINIDGFNEFASAADELSALFHGFTKKLQSVSIIDDKLFLNSILVALQKIVNLSNTFAKFKETILATNTIEIPKSIATTSSIISQVSDEVDCAMKYINNFVYPDSSLINATLSDSDKLIITKATSTIESWNSIVQNGVSMTMYNNTNVQYITQQNNNYSSKATILKATTLSLRNKFNFYNI